MYLLNVTEPVLTQREVNHELVYGLLNQSKTHTFKQILKFKLLNLKVKTKRYNKHTIRHNHYQV